MNIALIGSGGREHSICEKLLESNKIKKVFCIPGNAGTAMKAKNLNDKAHVIAYCYLLTL